MKQSLRFAVAAAAMGMVATASAGYFEVGTEVESYGSDYSAASDLALPYMAIGGNPIEGSALSLGLKTSHREMTGSSTARSSNRYRQDMSIGYSIESGAFTFKPGYLLRYESYQDGSRNVEHEFMPNMSYTLNDTVSLSLDTMVGVMQKSRLNGRGGDLGSDNSYNDFKYEVLAAVNTRLSDTQNLAVSIFTEGEDLSDVTGSEYEGFANWQLRLVYSQNFGDLTLTPYTRIGLSNKAKNANGDKTDQVAQRVGLAASYKLDTDLSLFGETYYQTAKNGDEADKNMMYYKAGVRYNF